LGTGGGDRGTNRQQHVTCGSAKLARLARGGFICAGRELACAKSLPNLCQRHRGRGNTR
jgi:hypothetical protein